MTSTVGIFLVIVCVVVCVSVVFALVIFDNIYANRANAKLWDSRSRELPRTDIHVPMPKVNPPRQSEDKP